MAQTFKVITLFLAQLLLGVVAIAEPLPPLDAEERARWQAVGPLNHATRSTKASCTGTLIAPDLVLTAAHCAGNKTGLLPHRIFVAGWDRGNYVTHRASVESIVHPAYEVAQGNSKFRYDIALLLLEEPISSDEVKPVPLLAFDTDQQGPFTVLGYQRGRPHILNGRSDCIRPDTRLLLHLDCTVTSGNSGGPVLIETDEGWRIVAVMVATLGDRGLLAVPIGDWVLQQWQNALNPARTNAAKTVVTE